jgi:hypothetical protein
MSIENGVTEAVVRIRTPRRDWMPMLVVGLVFVAMRALELMVLAGASPGGASTTGQNGLLFLGGVFVLESLLIRSFGVDLTSEFANIRGLLRRHVRWDQVQAVLCFRQWGADRVCLVLEDGQRVNLRAPTTAWGFGAARYEHDFHRIGQWWVAHRGPSWLPVRPEAPGGSAPG